MSSMTSPTGPRQEVFAGVDTHKATHHAAVLNVEGHLLQEHEFTTGSAGCTALAAWLGQWTVARVGVEQSGTYGASLARELTSAGHQVIDVNRPEAWVRAGQGKSDPIDAVMAAEAVRTGRARVIAKDRCGVIEAVRLLHTARRSAVQQRATVLVQIGDLAITAPAGLRDKLGTRNRDIAAACLRLRPDRTRLAEPEQAAKAGLRNLAERLHFLDEQITSLDADLDQLLRHVAPHLLARPYVGIHTAAQLLITAGQNIDRIGSEAKFARLTGVAPIPASSGQTHRMRLHSGGDRAANAAIHLVAVGRLRSHQPAIDYAARRTSEGLSKKDTIRAMKRLIARELYGALKADLRALDAT